MASKSYRICVPNEPYQSNPVHYDKGTNTRQVPRFMTPRAVERLRDDARQQAAVPAAAGQASAVPGRRRAGGQAAQGQGRPLHEGGPAADGRGRRPAHRHRGGAHALHVGQHLQHQLPGLLRVRGIRDGRQRRKVWSRFAVVYVPQVRFPFCNWIFLSRFLTCRLSCPFRVVFPISICNVALIFTVFVVMS